MRRRDYSTAGSCLALCCFLTLAAAPSCVRTPRRQPAAGRDDARQTATAAATQAGPLVNINKASRAELERLPGVGPATATRIVEHRERYGPFRRAEHLLLVRGFSDSRFRELRPLIAVD
jgi:competence protein ComEA